MLQQVIFGEKGKKSGDLVEWGPWEENLGWTLAYVAIGRGQPSAIAMQIPPEAFEMYLQRCRVLEEKPDFSDEKIKTFAADYAAKTGPFAPLLMAKYDSPAGVRTAYVKKWAESSLGPDTNISLVGTPTIEVLLIPQAAFEYYCAKMLEYREYRKTQFNDDVEFDLDLTAEGKRQLAIDYNNRNDPFKDYPYPAQDIDAPEPGGPA